MACIEENYLPEINFEEVFKIMLFAMRASRSHPEVPRDFKWLRHICFFYGLFTFAFLLLCYSTFRDITNKDFSRSSANGCLCLNFFVITMFYCILLCYQSKFSNLMDDIKKDYEHARSLPREEYDIVVNYANKGRTVIYIWLSISGCVTVLFPLKAIILMIYSAMNGEFRYYSLYEVTFPEIIELRKDTFEVFVLSFSLFLFFDVYALFMYMSMSPLGAILMLHACGQLELARCRVLKTFSKNIDVNPSDNLKIVAKHLQNIYSFVGSINVCLRLMHEVLFKAVGIILPVSMYQVVATFKKGEVSIEFITMIMGGIAVSSIPCYYSDMLMETSERVSLAMYSCNWESIWDSKVRNLVFLLLTRSAKPVAIRTVVKIVCLRVLTDIYHQTYLIFNVLNTIWE